MDSRGQNGIRVGYDSPCRVSSWFFVIKPFLYQRFQMRLSH